MENLFSSPGTQVTVRHSVDKKFQKTKAFGHQGQGLSLKAKAITFKAKDSHH